MATVEQVTQIMTLLSAKFPHGPELTEVHFYAYHEILGDIAPDLLMLAAKQVAANNTFFPAASELRKAAFAIMEKAEGRPCAWDAWAEVCRSFATHGYYVGAPEWSHALIDRAVEGVGGYAFLCHSDNPVADRARFIQAYEALAERERQDRLMLPAVREKVADLAAGIRVNYLPEGRNDRAISVKSHDARK